MEVSKIRKSYNNKVVLDIDKLESMLRELSKKYDMPIILRDRNITTNKRTIKVIA